MPDSKAGVISTPKPDADEGVKQTERCQNTGKDRAVQRSLPDFEMNAADQPGRAVAPPTCCLRLRLLVDYTRWAHGHTAPCITIPIATVCRACLSYPPLFHPKRGSSHLFHRASDCRRQSSPFFCSYERNLSAILSAHPRCQRTRGHCIYPPKKQGGMGPWLLPLPYLPEAITAGSPFPSPRSLDVSHQCLRMSCYLHIQPLKDDCSYVFSPACLRTHPQRCPSAPLNPAPLFLPRPPRLSLLLLGWSGRQLLGVPKHHMFSPHTVRLHLIPHRHHMGTACLSLLPP